MSRIFDVVQKDNIIDFGEIYQPGADELTGTLQNGVHPTRVSHPVASSKNGNRVVRLAASAFSPIFPFDGAHQEAAEQYRIIRTKIWQGEKKPQVVLVSSASSGDGKTVTSINIAASLALKEESRVLLVDGDLRHPRVSEALGVPLVPGLSEVLAGTISLESALVEAQQFPNLFILPAGNPGSGAAELLDCQRWPALMEEIRGQFSNVIADAPPIAMVADYELLQLVCDGVVVVGRPDHSDRRAFFNALDAVPKEKLLGVVLNCVEEWWLWRTPAYGYYGKENSERKL